MFDKGFYLRGVVTEAVSSATSWCDINVEFVCWKWLVWLFFFNSHISDVVSALLGQFFCLIKRLKLGVHFGLMIWGNVAVQWSQFKTGSLVFRRVSCRFCHRVHCQVDFYFPKSQIDPKSLYWTKENKLSPQFRKSHKNTSRDKRKLSATSKSFRITEFLLWHLNATLNQLLLLNELF